MVNENLLTPAYISYIEAKQSKKLFNKIKNKNTPIKKGKLTHINLWGKYEVASINVNQYYILFVTMPHDMLPFIF